MATVLLAIDGSEDARQAAMRAIEIAKEREATLHVLCVVDREKFSETAISADELATIVAEDHGYHCVDAVSEMAEGSDITVLGDVLHGVPSETIVEYAREIDADLIVVGEHGDHHDHFGGVGRRVTKMADCEVVVISSEAQA